MLHFNIIPNLCLCHLSDLFPACFHAETRNKFYEIQKPKPACIRIATDNLINSHKTPNKVTSVLKTLLHSPGRLSSIDCLYPIVNTVGLKTTACTKAY